MPKCFTLEFIIFCLQSSTMVSFLFLCRFFKLAIPPWGKFFPKSFTRLAPSHHWTLALTSCPQRSLLRPFLKWLSSHSLPWTNFFFFFPFMVSLPEMIKSFALLVTSSVPGIYVPSNHSPPKVNVIYWMVLDQGVTTQLLPVVRHVNTPSIRQQSVVGDTIS